MYLLSYYLFFFKQKTAYEMRISDWSSDVCSSDLGKYQTAHAGQVETVSGKVSEELLRTGAISLVLAMMGISIYIWIRFEWQFGVGEIGRASCRERVCQYV